MIGFDGYDDMIDMGGSGNVERELQVHGPHVITITNTNTITKIIIILFISIPSTPSSTLRSPACLSTITITITIIEINIHSSLSTPVPRRAPREVREVWHVALQGSPLLRSPRVRQDASGESDCQRVPGQLHLRQGAGAAHDVVRGERGQRPRDLRQGPAERPVRAGEVLGVGLRWGMECSGVSEWVARPGRAPRACW